MKRLALVVIAISTVLASVPANAQEYADELFSAMRWRNIGPFRGGRSVAVAGVPSDPLTYYFGSTGGGVWKTTDAGVTWTNVSDGSFDTGSVGAIAVAESDANVVYVGMGEHAVRGVTTSHGDGVYRSTDAGKTWTHLGLPQSRAISRIRVHPKDPDLVYAAVQGAPYGESEERGIYRSKDGGDNWERIHFVSSRAGASDLAMDMTNPRILYAAFWDHLRRPWVVESGGDGSGIWKSTDGGDTWVELEQGLPDLMGKIGIDVSRANPERVFANVEADDDKGGLYRSDDAGETWTHVNAERIIQARSWYYMEVYADPQDEETVYVLNAPMMRSIDGGRTFTNVQVPHGDNHDMWINPTNNKNIINANDGGANVSFNAGRSWSTQRNQPTVQFYRVNADNQFPYHLYGGQQDNSSVGIASAALGGVTWKDWYASAGCESAYLAFDPDRPQRVLGTCIQGGIDVWDRTTRLIKSTQPYAMMGLGTRASDQKYRFDWNAPIMASPHDPNTFFYGGNVVFKTSNYAQSWEVISPDLTRDEDDKQGLGGIPITNELAGAEIYNIIMYLIESPVEAGTIWVGTNDGLVHVTRDGGQTWDNVTPGGIDRAMINSIDASPHDPATAYVVATNYKFNDFTPLVFKTDDYGDSWQRITDGIEDEAWVRTVREDTERQGLLYAGTELGMYISFDDGDEWRKWQLNLPIVPITDLKVHHGDLLAATQGRGFWILDDLSPVRQLTEEVADADMHLFQPRDHVIVQWGTGFGPGGGPTVGQNPPAGAQLFYILAEAPDTSTLVTVEILENGGAIRTYTTDPAAAGDSTFTRIDTPKAGLNRFSWNFRRETPTQVPGIMAVGGPPVGRRVPPGDYQVRLTIGERNETRSLTLLPDPRWTATAAEYEEQERFLGSAVEAVEAMHSSANQLRGVRDQVNALIERTSDHEDADTIRTAGTHLTEGITEWEGELLQPKQKTFQDVINFENKLSAEFLSLIGSVDGTHPPVIQGARERLQDLLVEWRGHQTTMMGLLDELAAFNALIQQLGVPPIVLKGERPPRVIS